MPPWADSTSCPEMVYCPHKQKPKLLKLRRILTGVAGAPAATTILCEPAQGSAPSAAGWPTAARSRPIVGGDGARSTASSAARARSMPEIEPRLMRQFFERRRRSREILNADERFATRSARRDGVRPTVSIWSGLVARCPPVSGSEVSRSALVATRRRAVSIRRRP